MLGDVEASDVPWCAYSCPQETAGEWAGCRVLSGEEENKLAQFYIKQKAQKVNDFNEPVPVACLPEALCSDGALLPVWSLPHSSPLSPLSEKVLSLMAILRSPSHQFGEGWAALGSLLITHSELNNDLHQGGQ